MFEKIPFSEESEQYVLGVILGDSRRMDEVAHRLQPQHFYKTSHALIYETCLELYKKSIEFDAYIVASRLKEKGKNIEGGTDYIYDLPMSIPTEEHLDYHVGVLIEKYIRREAIRRAQNIIQIASMGETDSIDELVSGIEREIYDLRPENDSEFEDVGQGLGVLIEGKLEGYQKAETVMTGFKSFDEFSGGLRKGWLFVLSARPGGGKTAWSLSVAMNVARRYQDSIVVYYTLEMQTDELRERMLSNISGIPLKLISQNKVKESDFERLANAAAILNELNIKLNHTRGMTVDYLISSARRLKRQHGKISLIVVDYLGEMEFEERKGETRAAAIGRTVRKIKRLANELDCPIILLVQMNRAVDHRADKKPTMADLRESGDIEAAADVVAFLTRDVERSGTDENGNPEIFLEMNIVKGRSIGVADFGYRFKGHIQRLIDEGRRSHVG